MPKKSWLPPCCDEDDDGVPDFCRHHHCPLDHRNRCFGHRNPLCLMFGNVGWKFFDRKRKHTMGLAIVVTIIAIIFTTFGCFALSPVDRIVRVTHWQEIVADISALNLEDGAHTIKLYLGLSTMVVIECEDSAAAKRWWSSKCDWGGRSRFYWSSNSCQEPEMSLFSAAEDTASSHALIARLIMCDDESELKKCSEMLADPLTIALGAFMSCATLIFALLGSINRYKIKSDAPQQKVLGCLTDTWGALSLLLSVLAFDTACYYTGEGGQHMANDEIRLAYYHGPGIMCYIICIATGFIRAICHWLTPLPGLGVGACKFALPHVLSGALLGVLDLNGDGVVDIQDLMMMLDSHHAGVIVHPHEMVLMTRHLSRGLSRSVSHGAGDMVHGAGDMIHAAGHVVHDLEHNVEDMIHAAGHFVHDVEHHVAEVARKNLKSLLAHLHASGDGTLNLHDIIVNKLDADGDGKLDCHDLIVCCCCRAEKKVRDAEANDETQEIDAVDKPLPRSPLVAKLEPLAPPTSLVILHADASRWSPTQPAVAREPAGSLQLPKMPPNLPLSMTRSEAVEAMIMAGQDKKKKKKSKKKKKKNKNKKGEKTETDTARCLRFSGIELEDHRCPRSRSPPAEY
jgi:hypothetical protein